VILRHMPALSQEPFRSWFYQHWGRENCVISARARHAEYPMYRQRLSIKAAWGGSESYFVDGRRIAVDDETFLILNDDRTYASQLLSSTPVTSFSIFFRPRMAEEVARTHALPTESLLEEPRGVRSDGVEFPEQLRAHDRLITPVLRFIHRQVEAGVTDEDWLEEQLYFLLQRMLTVRRSDLKTMQSIPALRAGTRRELFRRVGLCVNFINTHYTRPIGLAQIAAAAHLSPYHCLRVFKTVHGLTPFSYLNRRRVRAAVHLLEASDLPIDDVAARVGFQCRATLFRHMRRARGAAPTAIRTAAAGQRAARTPLEITNARPE
jgi:AraC family transcriptional regulator